jgi:DNA mismatch endonuclease (patch repair protein)
MTDHVNPERRSFIMSSVQSKHTKPEMAIRSLVHGRGFRYRLHVATLPGKPDLVFPARRKIILVHGCFWHRHKRCRYATSPKTRTEFWQNKFCANVDRDRRTTRKLRAMGWAILVVWQCELKNPERLSKRIDDFLSSTD